jgi:hypothetical protein
VTGFWRLVRRLDQVSKRQGPQRNAQRQQRERLRRQATDRACSEPTAADASRVAAGAERRAATSCGWCGGPITPARRGPIQEWCSASCRQRAWEQRRAARSGRSAVEVVERQVEVRIALEPTRRDWPSLLGKLCRPTRGRAHLRPQLVVEVDQALRHRPNPFRRYVRRLPGAWTAASRVHVPQLETDGR